MNIDVLCLGCVGHRQGLGREHPALHPGAGISLSSIAETSMVFLEREALQKF